MSSESSDTDRESTSEDSLSGLTREEDSFVLGSTEESFSISPQTSTTDFAPGDLIGRYEFVKVLGKGGFGQVIEALDHRLNRRIAIKIPRLDKLEDHAVAFLEEARSVARLDHTSIIRVYNVEQTDDGLPFVVMEFVEGPTLAEMIRDDGLTFSQALRYFVQLAEALTYAHEQTLIHRDIKPANVIVSAKDDTAKLADFGMALHDLTPEENLAECPQGTPPYMSPEQLRGENHRLDRRTDIWGFGVLMYVVLTGKRPFHGRDLSELVRNICRRDPASPSEINPLVPAELGRICMRCLEKLMRNRYQMTQDLVDDLVTFQSALNTSLDDTFSSSRILPVNAPQPTSSSGKNSVSGRYDTSRKDASETLSGFRVVPKGLRSFDTQDTEFFMELIPGPKDRLGVPDSLRFWLNQLDPESTHPLNVGMIYGPSGCGKSSFVKAGLIPNLAPSIRTVYLEASPDNTETELLGKIKEIAPNVVRDETRLPVILSRIRRGQMMTGEKLLIVLDQFEQWLSVQGELARQPLVEALRHCDGFNLSCLLLIRDDFWMSASQFMNRLDLRVQEGVNALGIPLFDRRHARKVLSGYGRAIQALPPHDQPLDASQKKFVEASIDQIADNGQVVPIHIAMFAQMLDPESWQLSELKRQGGWQGIGLRFLNKIFSDKRLSSSESICRNLLAKLLPDSDSKIKGAEKSLSELMPNDASEKTKSQLRRVLDLLDLEFRIITPSESGDGEERHYQLAHDSLVIPVRTWLAQQQAQTWQGRSRARVKPLVSRWNERPENRFLPSLLEFLPLKLGLRNSVLTDGEQKYLSAATRYYSLRGFAGIVALLIAGFLFSYWWNTAQFQRAREHYQSLLRAPAAEVDVRLQMLERYSDAHRDQLVNSPRDWQAGPRAELYQYYAQAYFSDDPDEFPLAKLIAAIQHVEADESQNIVRLLSQQTHGEEFRHEIRTQLDDAWNQAKSNEEKIRLAIVSFHLDDERKLEEVARFHHDPELREQLIETLAQWHGPWSDLIEEIANGNNPALTSALCKSLGRVRRSQFSIAEYESFLQAVEACYLKSPEPSVHSAAEWVMNVFGEQIPNVKQSGVQQRWFVEQFGEDNSLTFVYIEPQMVYTGHDDQGPRRQELETGFFAATQEVSSKLFFEYLDSLPEFNIVSVGTGVAAVPNKTRLYFQDHPLRGVSDKNLPAYQLTWMEAVGFCNWLSKKMGRSPAYHFEQKTGEWERVSDADGYRLPGVLEFDALNRGGTSTKYFFGSTLKRLFRYACAGAVELPLDNVYLDYRGKRMPNNFGIFDSTGNAAEWCEREGQNMRGQFAYARGGGTTDVLVDFESNRIMEHAMDSRYGTGIRLVLDKK